MGSSKGLSGRPTMTIFPAVFNKSIRGTREWTAETVSIIPSRVPFAA